MTMNKLGHSDIDVSPLCFGGNVFGWTLDESRSFDMLDAFVDAGFNFVDTADMYSRWAPGNSGGESETIIGRWFARSGRRHQVVLATKVGMDMGEGRKGLRAQYIMQSVESSLARLQTDYIDLYQAHQDDPATPQDETLGAFTRLIEQGKVRLVGASNFSPDRLSSALDISAAQGIARYQTLQPQYNLVARSDFESGLQALCVREGISVIPYYSLASGFLSGKYRSRADAHKSARGPGIVEQRLNARGERILRALDTLSAQTGASLSTLSIAWLMSRPAVTAPIVSATTRAQLAELTAAVDLSLPADAIQALDEASAPD